MNMEIAEEHLLARRSAHSRCGLGLLVLSLGHNGGGPGFRNHLAVQLGAPEPVHPKRKEQGPDHDDEQTRRLQ